MILAGDIGGTRTRLAAFNTEGSKLQCVVEKTYPSQERGGLAEIVAEFIKTEGIPVHSACFGVAGPVRGGRSKISNLPWTIDSRELATQLKLDSVGLINDLEAYAYGVDALESKDLVTLQRRIGRRGRQSRRDRGPHRPGRGRPLLGWFSASSLRLRRRPHRLRAQERAGSRTVPLHPEKTWPREQRANSVRARHQEHL